MQEILGLVRRCVTDYDMIQEGETVAVGVSGMESGMSTVLVLSGVSTRETIKTYAYRPSMVLNGVGDIVSLARGEKTED